MTHRLLDVIAGRKDPAGLRQGSVLVDGKVVTSKLRLSSAYVVQVRLTHIHTHTISGGTGDEHMGAVIPRMTS